MSRPWGCLPWRATCDLSRRAAAIWPVLFVAAVHSLEGDPAGGAESEPSTAITCRWPAWRMFPGSGAMPATCAPVGSAAGCRPWADHRASGWRSARSHRIEGRRHRRGGNGWRSRYPRLWRWTWAQARPAVSAGGKCRPVAGYRMPFRGVDSSGERPHRRAQKNRLLPSAVLHWVSGVSPADGWGG
jgi:hypothetical protein